MNNYPFELLFAALILYSASAVISTAAASRRKLAGWINFIFIFAAGSLLIYLAYYLIFKAGGEQISVVNIGNTGVHLLLDGFCAIFIAIIGFMGIMSALYSIDYMEHYPEYGLRSYCFNFPIFLLGMTCIAVVDDLSAGFTFAWQLMTLSSFFLIRFEHRKSEIKKAALKYLVLMELAWAIILAGAFFIDGASFGDPLHTLSAKLGLMSGNSAYIVLGLLLVGFGFKAGIFPLGQLWLPDAHSIAPSPVSALLSGVMIKTGIYGIIRTFIWMAPDELLSAGQGLLWGTAIAALGTATLLIGTLQSIKQSDAKRLLAYSSIGQIGYIVLGIGAALFLLYSGNLYLKILSAIAIIGAVYHVINHAVFKGLLFLSSGSVLYAVGTKDLNRLGGLINLMPITAAAAGIASLSISGVPAFSGFASKWAIISSSLLAGSDLLPAALFGIIALFTSAVTLACYVKFFGMTFTSAGAQWNTDKPIKEVPWKMLLPKIVLTLLCVAQGLLPFLYFRLIAGIFQQSGHSVMSAVFTDINLENHIINSAMGVKIFLPGIGQTAASTAVPIVILSVFIAAFIFAAFLKRLGGSADTVKDPWLCGYRELDDKTRYRDSGMFSAFIKLFAWTGGSPKRKEPTDKGGGEVING